MSSHLWMKDPQILLSLCRSSQLSNALRLASIEDIEAAIEYSHEKGYEQRRDRLIREHARRVSPKLETQKPTL